MKVLYEQKENPDITIKSILILTSFKYMHMRTCLFRIYNAMQATYYPPPQNSERREMDRSIKQDVTPKHNND